MTIVQRRVFYGKVGTADSLVEWAKEMYGLIASQHDAMVVRIMTDHQSGRTDRLAVEVELEGSVKTQFPGKVASSGTRRGAANVMPALPV